MSKLPAPTNVYDADVAWAELRLGCVSLLFGKLDRNSQDGALRTRLEIKYPTEDFVRAFWGNSREFHESLRTYCDKWPAVKDRETLHPESYKAGKDHSEYANFDAIAHAGTEACIDFFLLPASAVARFARGQGSSQLTLAPIVRVNLTSFELLRLLDGCSSVAATIEKVLPSDHRGDGVGVQEDTEPAKG